MKRLLPVAAALFAALCAVAQPGPPQKIDRKAVVDRHRIVTTVMNPASPAQVGNGEFAFGADITGLQTFGNFQTLSHWSWHSFPMPQGRENEVFRGVPLNTHGRMVPYHMPNKEQAELSDWLSGNPHRFNLGRVGFALLKADGTRARPGDLKKTRQEVDLWTGTIHSHFVLENVPVSVQTACHPTADAIGVSVLSDLIRQGRLKIVLDFPYGENDFGKPGAHSSTVRAEGGNAATIARKLDQMQYAVAVNWTSKAKILSGDTIASKHRFYLDPARTGEFSFTCRFAREKAAGGPPLAAAGIFKASAKAWPAFWQSGAAIDLSRSKDARWKELERRVVLSQYLMRTNEAGSYPPQEAGLVNNGWYGRFHFEMIWWHGVHYPLWNRWPLFEKSLHVYKDFLPTSMQRAAGQGYKGVRWPKCTANLDRDWPHPIHAMLIWQQPHPIYFAELDYRLHPGRATLDKWREVVFQTAEFMADFAHLDKAAGRYVLGPPIFIVSENTEPEKTQNPAFELGYWRFGLRTAQAWRERLGLEKEPKWNDVLARLSPLPQQDGLYVTHENIDSMWTKFSFEHPALIGTYGMLPGDGVDTAVFRRTLEKVAATWNYNHTWGWDFPMLAMAAARTGRPALALDMLLHASPNFQFDEHGLATGGPFPYFPSNGALLTAVAMMAAGWDGSAGDAPGFPKDGSWTVRHEGFNRMP